MNDKDIRIAIARSNDYKIVDLTEKKGFRSWIWIKNGHQVGHDWVSEDFCINRGYQSLPDYNNDFNAIIAVIKALPSWDVDSTVIGTQAFFQEMLKNDLKRNSLSLFDIDASYLSEIYLKTIQEWKS